MYIALFNFIRDSRRERYDAVQLGAPHIGPRQQTALFTEFVELVFGYVPQESERLHGRVTGSDGRGAQMMLTSRQNLQIGEQDPSGHSSVDYVHV